MATIDITDYRRVSASGQTESYAKGAVVYIKCTVTGASTVTINATALSSGSGNSQWWWWISQGVSDAVTYTITADSTTKDIFIQTATLPFETCDDGVGGVGVGFGTLPKTGDVSFKQGMTLTGTKNGTSISKDVYEIIDGGKPNDGTLTIQKNGTKVATFTANQSGDTTANITVPDAANNGTLTIQKNGTKVATFTANQSGDTTANITVPTNNNELTNGAGYITSSGSCASATTVNNFSAIGGVTVVDSSSFSSSFTQDIFGATSSGYFLKEIRTQETAPSSLYGNYSSGIAWKGSDTYGSLMVPYSSAGIRVSGGNGNNPVWTVDLIHSGNIGSQIVAGVTDYNDSSRTIKIGYVGSGITPDYICGYTNGGTQIKDVTKDTLSSWLGLNGYKIYAGSTTVYCGNYTSGGLAGGSYYGQGVIYYSGFSSAPAIAVSAIDDRTGFAFAEIDTGYSGRGTGSCGVTALTSYSGYTTILFVAIGT